MDSFNANHNFAKFDSRVYTPSQNLALLISIGLIIATASANRI